MQLNKVGIPPITLAIAHSIRTSKECNLAWASEVNKCSGCGIISRGVLEKIWKAIPSVRRVESLLLRSRHGSAKGMLSLDSRLEDNVVAFRLSITNVQVPITKISSSVELRCSDVTWRGSVYTQTVSRKRQRIRVSRRPQRTVATRNKKFLLSFSDECNDVLQWLGFDPIRERDVATNQLNDYWTPPNLIGLSLNTTSEFGAEGKQKKSLKHLTNDVVCEINQLSLDLPPHDRGLKHPTISSLELLTIHHLCNWTDNPVETLGCSFMVYKIVSLGCSSYLREHVWSLPDGKVFWYSTLAEMRLSYLTVLFTIPPFFDKWSCNQPMSIFLQILSEALHKMMFYHLHNHLA